MKKKVFITDKPQKMNNTSMAIPYSPNDVKFCYNVSDVAPLPGKKRVVIGIVVAYDGSTSDAYQADFDSFCKKFNLPSSKIEVHYLGNININTVESDWKGEIRVNTQWSYAMNPNATIRLVVCTNNTNNDNTWNGIKYLSTDSNFNINETTDIISMSFGEDTESNFNQNNINNQYFFNPNICYFAASGDDSYLDGAPAGSYNVITVGETEININKNNESIIETIMPNSGCGISQFFSKPFYEDDINILDQNNMGLPQIVALGNSVSVYIDNTITDCNGTSVSAPIVAGIISNIVQTLINNNHPTLTTVLNSPNSSSSINSSSINSRSIQLQEYLFKNIYNNNLGKNYNKCFRNINTGTKQCSYNGILKNFELTNGYNVPSGIGSINGNNLLLQIVNDYNLEIVPPLVPPVPPVFPIESGLSAGAIVGITIGSLCLVIFLMVLLSWYLNHREIKTNTNTNTNTLKQPLINET